MGMILGWYVLCQLQGLGELGVLPWSILGTSISLLGLLVCMMVWSLGHLVVCVLVWYFGAYFLSPEWAVGVPRQEGHHLSLN